MTFLEKFYEWWEDAEFENIVFTFIFFTLSALLAALIIGLIIGGIQ